MEGDRFRTEEVEKMIDTSLGRTPYVKVQTELCGQHHTKKNVVRPQRQGLVQPEGRLLQDYHLGSSPGDENREGVLFGSLQEETQISGLLMFP